MPISPAFDRARDAEALTRLVSNLQRYAGWLAKDHASVVVRADVRALDAAMDTGHELSRLVLTLDEDLRRLPSGSVRTMLRKALGEIRAVLEPTESST